MNSIKKSAQLYFIKAFFTLLFLVAIFAQGNAQKATVEYRLLALAALEHPDSQEEGEEEYKWRIIVEDGGAWGLFTCDGDGECLISDINRFLKSSAFVSSDSQYPSESLLSMTVEFWEDDCGSNTIYEDAYEAECLLDEDDTHIQKQYDLNPGKPLEYSRTETFEFVNDYFLIIISRESNYETYPINITTSGEPTWITGGNKPFWGSYGPWGSYYIDHHYFNEGYTAASGSINTNETSTIETTVEGLDSVTFQHKIDGGKSRLYVDGEVLFEQTIMDGNLLGNFDTTTIVLDPKSSHTLKWEFTNLTTGENALFARMLLQNVKFHSSPITTNPNDFGQNEWLVHAYEGDDLDLTTNDYRGMYIDTNFNINTENYFDKQGAPTEPDHYTGQYVSTNKHTVVHKREGFTCGDYSLNINHHDDGIRIYIDGNQVFENTGWGLSHPAVWSGKLDEISQVEIRTVDHVGSSITNVEFVRSTPYQAPFVTYSSSNICTSALTLEDQTTDYGYTRQWYKNGNPLVNETNSTLNVSEKGEYYFVLTEPFCDLVSDTIHMTDHHNILPTITILEGESAMVFGEQKSIPGDYEKFITANNGCDSIIIQPLRVLGVPPNSQCGYAINLNGNNEYITLDDSPSGLFPSEAMTVDLWFNTTSLQKGTLFGVNTASGGNVLLIQIENGIIKLYDGADEQFEIESKEVYTDAHWHHLVYTRNETTGRLYIDKILKGHHYPGFEFTPTDQWTLGMEYDNSTTSDFYQGMLDQVSFWSDEKSENDIIQDTYSDLDGSEPLLIAGFKFDEIIETEEIILNNHITFYHYQKDESSNNISTRVIPLSDYSFRVHNDGTPGLIYETQLAPVQLQQGEYLAIGTQQLTTPGLDSTLIPSSRGCDSLVISEIFYEPLNDVCGATLQLDGTNDYIDLAGVEGDIGTGENITIEAWIKTTSTTSNSIVSVNTSTGGNVVLVRIEEGYVKLYDGSSSTFEIISTEQHNDDKWHHVTYTKSGTTGRLYVDGKLIGSHAAGYSFSINNQWSIGQEFDGATPSDFFQGSIDEVVIWNKTLSQTEIVNRILDSSPVDDVNVISYYDFNAYTGTTSLTDIKSNHDGVFMGIDVAQSWKRLDGSIAIELVETASGLLQRGDSLAVGNGTYTTTPGLDTIVDGCEKYIIDVKYEPLNDICDAVLNFDGSNDYIDLQGVAQDIGTDTNLTIEAWIKTEASGSNSIVSVNTSTGGNVVLLRIDNGQAKIYDGSNSTFEIESSTLYNDNQWHHFTYSKSGSIGNLFVDGTLIGTHTADFTMSSSDQWSIGQEYDGTSISDEFTGFIDEVVIWNKTLTQSEIKNRILDNAPVDDVNVISYYDFNGRSGDQSLTDEKSSNHGMLTNIDLTQSWVKLDGSIAIVEVTIASSTLQRGDSLAIGNGEYTTTPGIDTVKEECHQYVTNITYEPLNKACDQVLHLKTPALYGTLYSLSRILPSSSDATLEIWFKTMSSDKGDLIRNSAFKLGIDDGYITIDDNGSLEIISNIRFNDNRWHHIAYTKAGNIGSLYVDAQFYGTHTIHSTFPYDNAGWTLGAGYEGKVDELILWDKALTSTEIKERLLSIEQVELDEVVSYFNFNKRSWYGYLNDLKSQSNGILNTIDESVWETLDGSGATYDTVHSYYEIERGGSALVGDSLVSIPGVDTIYITADYKCDSVIISHIMYKPQNESCDNVLQLSATEDVNLSDLSDENLTDVSIGFWMKTTESTAKVIMIQDNSSYGFRIEVLYGYLYLHHSFSNSILSNFRVDDGFWHHIVYTQSSSSGRLFVDGQIVGNNNVAVDFTEDISWELGGVGEIEIDEMFVLNHALQNENEVKEILLNKRVTELSGALATYDFNKGFGTTNIIDETGDNTGILSTQDVSQNWVTLNGNYQGNSFSQLVATSCNNYTLADQVFDASGTYQITTSNSSGCDSIIDLELTIQSFEEPDLTDIDEPWIISVYNQGQTERNGYFVSSKQVNDMDVNTEDYYPQNSTPSSSVKYTGCDVDLNDHAMRMKRAGLFCGKYQMNLDFAGSSIQVLINSEVVYSSQSAVNTSIWTGYLGSEDTIEIQSNHQNGQSKINVEFVNLLKNAAETITLDNSPTIPSGDYDNLYIGGSVPTSFEDGVNINGNLIIEEYVQIVGAYTLNVGGDYINFAKDDYLQSEQTINLTGSIQHLKGCNRKLSFQNLVVNGALGVIADDSIDIYGNLSLNTPGCQLKTNGHQLTLRSTEESTAQLTEVATAASINGDVTVEQYMDSYHPKWWYISTPFTDMTVAGWQTTFPITGNFLGTDDLKGANKPSLYYYNEHIDTDSLGSSWTPYPTTSNNASIEVGRGYSAFIRDDINVSNSRTLSTTGSLTIGSTPLPVYHPTGGNGALAGWNLVGNPYACEIDWDAPDGWSKTNINNAIYIKNTMTGKNTTWVGGIGIGRNDGIIGAQQAFWVKSYSDSPSLTIHEAAKSTTYKKLLKTSNVSNILRLQLTNSIHTAETVVRFHEDGTFAFDRAFDAYLLDSEISLAFGSLDESGDELVINTIAPSTSFVLPLVTELTEQSNQNLSISISGWSSIEAYDEIYLVDHYLNKEVKVDTNFKYDFNLNKNASSKSKNRFSLKMKNLISSLPLSETDDFLVYPIPSDGQHFMFTKEFNYVPLSIINLQGSVVYQNTKFNGYSLYLDEPLTPGMYFVKVTLDSGEAIKKITVN